MTDMGSENLFSRSARSAVHQLDEVVHVAAVYLGIAVLVTLALSVLVPSLREQSQNVHTALMTVLRPEVLQEGTAVSFDQVQSELLADADEHDDDEPAPPAAPAQPDSAAAKPPAGPGAGHPAATAAASSAGSSGSSGNPEGNKAGGANAAGSASKSNPASAANFIRAIKASADGVSIPGVTSAQAQALRSYIARKYQIAYSVAGVLIKTAFTVGREKKLDPQLLLAVIAIESRYNPYAESHVGAQGLMQVMAKVHKDKFDRYGEGAAAALNPIANIRVGSQILSDCIKRRGSIQGGLACYVGSTGPSDGGYGAKVLAERRRIALASGIPIGNE
jgi:soluble lytic murein transglycosylase-like protein